jgi:hypothetical protein
MRAIHQLIKRPRASSMAIENVVEMADVSFRVDVGEVTLKVEEKFCRQTKPLFTQNPR